MKAKICKRESLTLGKNIHTGSGSALPGQTSYLKADPFSFTVAAVPGSILPYDSNIKHTLAAICCSICTRDRHGMLPSHSPSFLIHSFFARRLLLPLLFARGPDIFLLHLLRRHHRGELLIRP